MTESSFTPQHPWGNLSLFLLSQVSCYWTYGYFKENTKQSGLLYKPVYWVERWLKSKHLKMCFISKEQVGKALITSWYKLWIPSSASTILLQPLVICIAALLFSRMLWMSGKEKERWWTQRSQHSGHFNSPKHLHYQTDHASCSDIESEVSFYIQGQVGEGCCLQGALSLFLSFLPHQPALAASLWVSLGIVALIQLEFLHQARAGAEMTGKNANISLLDPVYLWPQKDWLTGSNGGATVADIHRVSKIQCNMKLHLRVPADASVTSGCSLWLLLLGEKVCLRCGRAASRKINSSAQDVQRTVLWAGLYASPTETCSNMIQPFILCVV